MQRMNQDFVIAVSIFLCAFFEAVTCDVATVAATDKGRVIEGDIAERGQFPWAALVVCNNYKIRLTCSGSLLSEKFVLTAAHCVDKMQACMVQLGIVENRLREKDPNESYGHISRTTSNMHSCYRKDNGDGKYHRYDIALVQLQSRVNLTWKGISVIRLPTDDTIEGLQTTAVGWGLKKSGVNSKVLRYTQMKVLSHEKCVDAAVVYQDPLMTCATSTNPKQMVCSGDSGGPLVHGDGDEAVLVAITVFIIYKDEKCVDGNEPQGFMRVHPKVAWIRKVMETGSDKDADDGCETFNFKKSAASVGTFQDSRWCFSTTIFNSVVFYFTLS